MKKVDLVNDPSQLSSSISFYVKTNFTFHRTDLLNKTQKELEKRNHEDQIFCRIYFATLHHHSNSALYHKSILDAPKCPIVHQLTTNDAQESKIWVPDWKYSYYFWNYFINNRILTIFAFIPKIFLAADFQNLLIFRSDIEKLSNKRWMLLAIIFQWIQMPILSVENLKNIKDKSHVKNVQQHFANWNSLAAHEMWMRDDSNNFVRY